MQDIYEYLRYTANIIAASEFGKKMILKGGSVLISKLIECGRMDLYRLTSDLDIHCDKAAVWVDFYTNIEAILNKNDRNYVYRLVRRRSEEKPSETSDSLKFTIQDNDTIVNFKIDMNIKSNRIITIEYSPILNMNTYDALTMLSDKIAAVSSPKIYRRIKDLYDIAVLASLYDFNYLDVMGHIQMKHPDITLENELIPDHFDQISHAYDKYEGIVNKPDIRELVAICCSFLEPFYLENDGGNMRWNTHASLWQKC